MDDRTDATPDEGVARRGPASLTFAGGGWVIALAGVLVVALFVWSTLPVMLGRRPTGDGRSIETYGFDLSNLAVARDTLIASGNPRGFLPSLDDPKHLRGSDMAVYNTQNRPKFVVSTDRVLGIVIDGQPHAWPLSLLNVHEVVNDTVAGRPVAATYSPLCDSGIVFDRTIAGEVRSFEVSGLLYDSNLVFSDKRADGTPSSLFSQLERRAIAGPLAAAGVTMTPLPGAAIIVWADWLALHPDTTVTLRDPRMIRRMKEINYAHYFLSNRFEAPFAPQLDAAAMEAAGLRAKSPLLAIRGTERWNLVPIEHLVKGLAPDRRTTRTIEGVEYLFTVPSGPAVARVERTDGAPVEVIPLLYFAAQAILAEREGVVLVGP